MTESEIIEVAREVFGLHNPSIITFANAIAQRTRDECADLCEEYGWGVGDRCADKIRSMK